MPSKVSFKVIHVSGQDDVFKAVELNSHSPTTKGWQSSRFCLYPQDIVIQLERRSRLRKIQILSHQYLIATKIEFYVGDVPDGTPVSLQHARYTRLGYVSLSDNEKTGFKARELKSVHVDAHGMYLKFVIHKNHVNKHNLYNQVGVVALNVIGDDINKPDVLNYPHIGDDRLNDDPTLGGLPGRPDYISPLDDLAFDMYQDPEVAQIIKKLDNKKQEAVLQERYDYAKKLKNAIQDLQKVGEKLGKYEVEKRQAVENEDYDKAKLKKLQMDEYRLQVYKQLELHDLMELSGSRHPQKFDLEQTRQTPPLRLTELPPPRMDSPPYTPYDDRILPAIKNTARSPRDDDLPADDGTGNVTGEAEPMTEKDMREAGSVIEVFGLPLVSKAYSKTWSFREDALLAVYKEMSELPASTHKDDVKSMLRAATFLVARAIKDKVFAVFKAALNLLKMILNEYVPIHKIARPDTVYCVDKTLPPLIQKTGETAVRQRETAKDTVYEMAKYPEVKPLNSVPLECVKPFKLTIAPRLALSRTEMVDHLYKNLGLDNSGLTVENIMMFCTMALQHTAGEVREKAEKIIVALYKDVGAPVKNYLPPDDDKTRRNVLYKQMFEAFDRIDGKPSKEDLKRKKESDEQHKQKEIEALQAQLQALKDLASGKGTDETGTVKDDKSKKDTARPKGKQPNKTAPSSDLHDDDTSTVYNIDSTCIFCGERNESFTDEGLDLHYWKSCPMLKRCANCKQVVEIAGLTEHLLSECEAKDNYSKCPRCSEAILKADYDQHVKDKACNPSEQGKNHCPLCHQNIPLTEDGWKNHLMGKDGCKQNPRRLQALNKQPAGNKGQPTGRGKSKIPAPGTKAKNTPRR